MNFMKNNQKLFNMNLMEYLNKLKEEYKFIRFK